MNLLSHCPGKRRFVGLCGTVAAVLASGCSTPPPRLPQPGEVTVSSINYATTSFSKVASILKSSDPVAPQSESFKPLASPMYFLFAKGDYYPVDLSFDQILRFLTPALASKGYLEASSSIHSGRNPTHRIDLVLRVHCGERRWRDPIVRDTDLTWDDGLVPKLRTQAATGATEADVAWDARAGGDDAAMAAIEQAIGQAASGHGSRPGRGGRTVGLNDPNNPVSGLTTDLVDAMPTRDFYLLVVEAFDYHELRTKKGAARQLWSTFIAMPKKPGQTFSQVLPELLTCGQSYFGETGQGLAVFSDAKAHVLVKTPYEVPTSGPSPASSGGP